MHSLAKLQKQQVGLRLPKYLLDELDELGRKYGLNRTDIITESIRFYLAQQEAQEFYESFDRSCKELEEILENRAEKNTVTTMDELLDEL